MRPYGFNTFGIAGLAWPAMTKTSKEEVRKPDCMSGENSRRGRRLRKLRTG
jgi:hypothetical protein